MTKKILMLAPQPFFTERGTPINVREMLNALSGEGYKIDLLTYPLGDSINIENVNIIRSTNIGNIKNIPIGPSLKKIILDIPFLLKAIKLSLTNKYDLYHGIEEAGLIVGMLGVLTNTPYIFDVDSSMSDQLRQSGFIKCNFILKLFEKLEIFFWKRAKTNLTVCTALSDEIRKLASNANISQVEDFPVEEKLQESDSLNIREKLNIPAEDKIILYAGNFEPYQGVDLLIDSIALTLKETDIPHSLILIGGEEAHIANYKTKVANLGLSDKIKFLGRIPSRLISLAQSQADILASPRLSGTNTPLKIYGYMQSGKAIVATNIFSHTQVLNNENSYLSELTAESFSSKTIEALSPDLQSTEIRLAKIQNAKTLVETQYSVSSFHKKIKAVYKSALTSSIETRVDIPPDVASSSNQYAKRFSGPVGEYFLEVQESAIREMIKQLPSGSKVLDIGGGHCQLTKLFLERNFDITILGSDERSFERPLSLGYAANDNLHYQTGDLLSLPFQNNSFDLVIGIRLLSHIEVWPIFLKEMSRVSSNLVIFDYSKKGNINYFSEIIFNLKKRIERSTRPFLKQSKVEITAELSKNNFTEASSYPQFALPMGLHRMLKKEKFSRRSEDLLRQIGLTKIIGSPVIMSIKKEK